MTFHRPPPLQPQVRAKQAIFPLNNYTTVNFDDGSFGFPLIFESEVSLRRHLVVPYHGLLFLIHLRALPMTWFLLKDTSMYFHAGLGWFMLVDLYLYASDKWNLCRPAYSFWWQWYQNNVLYERWLPTKIWNSKFLYFRIKKCENILF